MDDCSPDDTAVVATSFQDVRIRHIRNAYNLGHLRNYNKGICLSRGKYVWLISADDYLRTPHVLRRYVELLNQRPKVGYTVCPGVGVRNGQEVGVLPHSVNGNRDRVINGLRFLKMLLNGNSVIAASVLVRRQCYEQISVFPLTAEMKWSGDWYLWCVFALYYDVGYFAEPMVCYREHDLSMTTTLTQNALNDTCAAGDIAVPWMIRQKAKELGLVNVTKTVSYTHLTLPTNREV